MVSQSGPLGITIMGKTADLTVVQKTITDSVHEEGKTQKVIAKEFGCSQSAVSKHINGKLCGKKEKRERKGAQAKGMPAAWRGKGHSKVLGTFIKSRLRLELVHQEPPHKDGSWTRVSTVILLSSLCWFVAL